MIQSTIKLTGDVTGYLDLFDDLVCPITLSVADIRDISKRSGVFSKTITIPGTGNNNQLLGYHFDVNIQEGTYNINKLQECQVIQNGVPILENAYIQLVSIRRRQNSVSLEDIIEYDLCIKDQVSNFFSQINGKELQDLPSSQFINWDHTLDSTTIIDSFTNTEGYKYWLPQTDEYFYYSSDLSPAIFAKVYWDLIHQTNGFSYTWDNMSDPFVLFDKLLITDNKNKTDVVGDINKFSELIVSQNPIAPTTPITTTYTFPTTPIIYGSGYSMGVLALFMDNQIKDVYNNYETFLSTNPLLPYPGELTTPGIAVSPSSQNGISVWHNPYNFNSGDINTSITINFDFKINNSNVFYVSNNIAYTDSTFQVYLRVKNNALSTDPYVLMIKEFKPGSVVYPTGDTLLTLGNNIVNIDIPSGVIGDDFTFSLEVLVGGSGFSFENAFTGSPASVTPVLTVNNATLNTKLLKLVVGSDINISAYIPKKIKQSDFIKSIALMYNLYCIPDPNNINNLIWIQRDVFYDSGIIKDWTKKLAKDKEQSTQFLPDLTSKSIIFTYKQDKDPANTSYNNATKEIYGQQKVTFDSEWVKDIETKEIIFSPTPMEPSAWGGVNPILDNRNGDYNLRIFLDAEVIQSDNEYAGFSTPYILDYSDNTVFPPVLVGNYATLYPLTTHTNSPFGGNFDINFGVCDYYFFEGFTYTQNNLYNLNWKRTMAQINSSKMLTAEFRLTPTDIKQLKLNDKIRIDNSYWNINRVIDYDFSKEGLTKVELISIDDSLILNAYASNIVADKKIDKNLYKSYKQVDRMQKNLANSSLNTNKAVISMGERNVFNDGFVGIAVGSDLSPSTTSGIFVGDLSITPESGLVTPGYLINDGGLDAV